MRHPIHLAIAALAVLALCLVGGAAASSRGAMPRVALPHLGVLPVTPLVRTSAGAPQALSYHGGAVLHASTAYAVFWSPPAYPMPSDWVASVTRYFQDQASSTTGSSYSVAAQYFDTQGPAGTHSTFGGPIVVPDAPPPTECQDDPVDSHVTPITECVHQSTLDALVQRLAAARGITASQSAIFFLFLPPGMGTCWDDGVTCSYRAFAAYHSATDSGLLYAVHPFFDDRRLDGVAHEHIETLTDPTGEGWFVDNSGEIADLCADAGSIDQRIGASTYHLPREWSNAAGGCSAQTPPPATTLTLATKGKGTGDILARFSGQELTCGVSAETRTCVTVARQGAHVALAATASDGFGFAGWDAKTPCTSKRSPNCAFTTTAGRANVTASFGAASDAADLFLLSVDVKGHGAVVLPSGKRCRSSCIVQLNGGTVVALKAVPDKGWKLKLMRDDTHACSTRPRCTIRLHDSDNVFASFVRR
jgi:hypothetical protein